MRIVKNSILILAMVLSLSCSKKKNKVQEVASKSQLNGYLTRAMEVHGIPGLTLAIIEDGEVVYKNQLGNTSIETNELVGDQAIFRVFSATKLITATGVFQLIEKGKISLEDKISDYFENLPETWQNIRIKHLLTHSSGLPELIYKGNLTDDALLEKLFNDKINFKTGNQFRYNQTNYWLLAQIIEHVTALPFDEYILKNQFNSVKKGVLFSSNSKEMVVNRATRYYYNGLTNTYEKDTLNSGPRGHAGNGLNITLDEFVKWDARLDAGELLAEETKKQMWTPFQFGNGNDKFLHGWGIYDIKGSMSYGFTGGNLAGFRKFVNDNMTIILLSNGYVHPAYDIIINDVAKITSGDFETQKLILEGDVMKLLLDKKYDDANTAFKNLRRQDPDYNFDNLKWNINSLGNNFLRNDKIEEACSVYLLNAEVNPDWWVAQGSYAEGLDKKGDSIRASDFYMKAIQLNINNEYDYNPFMTNRIKELKE